jgi:alpha-galactosidase
MSDLRLEQGEQGPALTNGLVTVILNGTRGTFDILSAGRAMVSDASAGVSLRDGPAFTTRGAGFFLDGERSVTDALGRGLEVVLRREPDEHEPDLALSVTLYEGSPHVVLRAEVVNRSAPIRVQSFSVLEGGHVDLGSPVEGWRFFEEGWQNWSVAVVLPVSGEELHMAPPVVGPTTQPDAKAGRFVAELVGAVVDPATNAGVVAGFISTADQFSQVWFDREGPALTAASYADGVTVEPGQRLSSERLLVQPTAAPLGALQNFGDAIAAEMKAVPWPEPVEGWCSWYYYWQGVSEEHMLANLGYLAEHRRELPVEYVQIDDGYQAEIGDWLTPNEKFPHGMGWIAGQIHQRGFRAGLWLAPFMIGAKSKLYEEHPDWAVQFPSASLRAGKQGKPYVAMVNWAQECYSMDLTRPDVMDWLEKVFTTVFNEWKFDYIKIDFLYAGAVDGIRSNPNVTRAQAYRRAIEKIREIAGERFILGCGHPMGPSIGIMNGSRISPDVAPFWYPHERPREEGRSDLSTVSTFNAIRNTMVRFWMHNRIWLNDPDCMLARDTDTALTLAEVQSLATVIGLSGGMMLDSDNLTKLSPERRDMISMLQPVYGKSAIPLDLFRSETPTLFELDCGSQKLLGVFNWADEPAEVTAPLPDEASHVFELWEQKYVGGLSTSVSSEIPAHGCRLYSVRGTTGRPQVIGSTFHLLQGTMEITREDWPDGVLRVSLRPVAKADGELFIHVPDGFGPPAVDGASVSDRGNGAWSIGLRVDTETEILVRFGG